MIIFLQVPDSGILIILINGNMFYKISFFTIIYLFKKCDGKQCFCNLMLVLGCDYVSYLKIP